MIYKKLPVSIFLLSISLLLISSKQSFSQTYNSKQSFEDIYEHWFNAMDKFRATESLNKSDFDVFQRFSENTWTHCVVVL